MEIIIYALISLGRPYYYNEKIHNFGNIGWKGRIHAQIAPFATKFIDIRCYDGRNIRNEIMLPYKNINKKVLDLCCGTGISTINNNNAIGIDTSFEMLKIAKRNNKNAQFYFGNAEYYIPPRDIDIVSCMFAFHEIPLYAQKNIIINAINIAKEKVIIVDISPNYKPSKTMLTGEPYILEYLSNIQGLLDKSNFEEYEYIKGHVNIWTFCK